MSQTLLFVTTQLLVTVLTYGYYVTLGRVLAPEDFARYAALTALFTVYTVIGIGLTQAAARATALGGRQVDLEQQTRRFGWLATGLVALCSVVLHGLSGLPAWWLGMLALVTLPYALLSTRRGVLLAEGRSAALGISFAVEHAGKILLTLGLTALLPLVDAAALALALSLALAYFAQLAKPAQLTPRAVTMSAQDFGRDTISIGSATLAQLLSANADLLVAQMLLPGAAGGLYASAALVARIVLIGSSAVQTSSIAQLSKNAVHAGRLMYGLIFGGGAVFVLATLIFGGVAMRLGFGERYGAASALLPYLALGALGFAVGHARLQHRIALGQRLAGALGFAGVGIQLVALLLAQRDPLELARAQCVAGLTFAAIVWAVRLNPRVQQGGHHVVPSF